MPHNWFPDARSLKRRVIYHLGPTNSGKTHNALKELIKAKTGIYCAPLRLLAWEIQDKLQKNNIKCDLKTGQEKIEIKNSTHFSCTVEMCPTTIHYECAILDEIQMISDPFRGFAWTNAFLGVKADEIHVCGDERALKLIYHLCELTGDSLTKKSYTRLSDLIVDEESIHSVSQLKKGDCIITFSKKDIFELKNIINNYNRQNIFNNDNSKNLSSKSPNKCALIYGSLPPETKKLQANIFNNGLGGVEFMVATDAIGMGLNLNIKRIIFSKIFKRDQDGTRILTKYELKQIAGRAGRSDKVGYVSAFKHKDLDVIRKYCSRNHKKEIRKIKEEVLLNENRDYTISESDNHINFSEEESEIEKACLFPPLQTIVEFSKALQKFKIKSHENSSNSTINEGKNYSNNISLSETLKQFENLTRISDLYFTKNNNSYYEVHKIIEDIKDADLTTQYYFTICPIKISYFTTENLHYFLKQFVSYGVVKLPQNFHLDCQIFTKNMYKMKDLSNFEKIYNVLEIYVWLSYKFEKEFIERELANVLKERVSKIIESILQNSDFDVYSDLRTEKIHYEEQKRSNKKNLKMLTDNYCFNEPNKNNSETIDIDTI